jgi:hypothetical protein
MRQIRAGANEEHCRTTASTAFWWFKRASEMKKLAELHATTFFSDSPMTRVDGSTENTLGFK